MDFILEILGKIGFDWRMALANLVNFLIIFWLLKRYAFEPVKKMLQERQERISEGLDSAEKAKTELMMAKENYSAEMNKARAEAQEIVQQAYEQSKAMIARSETEAQEKVRGIVQEAREAIRKERDAMERELQQKTVTIAVAIAEKVLKKTLDEKTEAALIKELSDSIK